MNGGIQRQLTGSDVPDGATEGRCNASPSHPPVDPGVVLHAPGSANPALLPPVVACVTLRVRSGESWSSW